MKKNLNNMKMISTVFCNYIEKKENQIPENIDNISNNEELKIILN